MKFRDFRQAVETELSIDNYFFIIHPNNKADPFFWVAVNGGDIGTTLCHYEFTLDGNDSNKVNLEIHFEFLSENGSESEKNASALLGKYLLNKPIMKRYDSVSKSQVGIIYDSFYLDADSVVQDAIEALKKMDKEFQLEFSKFIKKSSCRKLLKNKKECKPKELICFYGRIIYPCLLLILLVFVSIFIFKKSFSNSEPSISYEKSYTENRCQIQDSNVQH